MQGSKHPVVTKRTFSDKCIRSKKIGNFYDQIVGKNYEFETEKIKTICELLDQERKDPSFPKLL